MAATTTATQSTHDMARLARARSDVYGLLAAVLRYPDDELLAALCASSAEAAAPLGDSLRRRVAAIFDAARGVTAADLAERYVACVGHAVRGACPPYEQEYGGAEIIQRASQLADIAGFYNAFGLTFDGPAGDRPDHAAAECEFLGVLTAKQAVALEAGDDAHAQMCDDAQRAFLDAHWGQWASAFAHRLTEADGEGFYGCVARCVQAFVAAECEGFELAPGPEYLELRPADPEADMSQACAVGPACGEGSDGGTNACGGNDAPVRFTVD